MADKVTWTKLSCLEVYDSLNTKRNIMDTETTVPEPTEEVTPSEIQPELRPICGFWRRIVAMIIDGICLGLVATIPGLFLFAQLTKLGGWGRLLGFAIGLIYLGVFNSKLGKGQTFGKRVMKIEVVDRTGAHLSLTRATLRYAVFGIPFFLNGVMIPPGVTMSPFGFLIGFVIFWGMGSIIYLYIFNRKTRQSLHDLAVGSFVTTRTAGGSVAGSVWRPHLIVVGILMLLIVILTVLSGGLAKRGIFPELLLVQQRMQDSGKVHVVSAKIGKTWSMGGGGRSETTYFQSTAVWKGRPDDSEAAAREMAALILKHYAKIEDMDLLSVSISYGYDLGIARAWRSNSFRHSPAEWEQLIGDASSEQ